MDSVIALPQVAAEINFLVPLALAIALFAITQIGKNLPAMKKFKPDLLLWPLAIITTGVLAFFYQPDMTVKEVYLVAGTFVANAGALHLGKKYLWDNLPLLLKLFAGKQSQFPG